jgi:hypothetical protein
MMILNDGAAFGGSGHGEFKFQCGPRAGWEMEITADELAVVVNMDMAEVKVGGRWSTMVDGIGLCSGNKCARR